MPVTKRPDWNNLANRPTLASIATTGSASDLTAGTIAPDRLNASGSAPVYPCRAWVNFNGTGTVAIRASGNVSSITDLGASLYRLNFATAMQDANYAVLGTANSESGVNYGGVVTDYASGSKTTSAVDVQISCGGGSAVWVNADLPICSVAIFR